MSVLSAKPFSWPFSWDALRDIGIAQSMLDGHFFQDPIMEGEVNWYNPLVGIIIAIIGKISHLPLPEIYVKIGPFVTLLLPVSLVLFAYKLGGAMASLAILCYCIFARHPLVIEWIYGCYLPWLYATHLGKAFFFLFLTALIVYKENRKNTSLILSGVFLGLAFLSHTSAFVEGVLILIFIAIWENKKEIKALAFNKIFNQTRYIIAVGGIALLVSSIYWLPILIKYQFIIKNPYPSLYVTTALEPQNILSTLLKSANSFTVIGSICLIVLLFNLNYSNLNILRFWASVILFVLAYQIFCQILNKYGYIIPAPYPVHHTFISIHLLIGCFFGYGLSIIGKRIANKISTKNASNIIYDLINLLATVSALTVCILINAYSYTPRYLPPLSELNRGRPENRLVDETQKYDEVYHWLLKNTQPQDKILCNELLGVRVVLPAGRKLTYTLMLYLNPYVDISIHLNKFNNIWMSLKEGKFPDFVTYLRREGIRYILVHNSDPEISLLSKTSKLKKVYSDNLVSVFQVMNLNNY